MMAAMPRAPVGFSALSLLAGFFVWYAATPAMACASCGCGDPTLTGAGTEQPFRNRIRVSAAALATVNHLHGRHLEPFMLGASVAYDF
jgi:hypothetical protein